MKNVLSGDPSVIAQTLAPEISADKTATQQDQKTQAMFGGRSGGTAAFNANAADKVHSDITNSVGSLMGGAASGLTNAGVGLIGTGIRGTDAAFSAAAQQQQQKANQWNDIFKSGASLAAGVVGGLPAGAGSWQDIFSNAAGQAAG